MVERRMTVKELRAEVDRLRNALWAAGNDFRSLCGQASYCRTVDDAPAMANKCFAAMRMEATNG